MNIEDQINLDVCCSAQQVADRAKAINEQRQKESEHRRIIEAGARAGITRLNLL